MKIVFFGSDDFAVTNLDRLLKAKHEVAAVVTPPDKAKGRGMKMSLSPVKEFAGQNNIPVLQPHDLKDQAFVQELTAVGCDLFIVIAYGKFLPAELLNIPKKFSLNVHASLLPKYRGAAPINWAIVNGEKETGVSIIAINERMDAGDILLQGSIEIEQDEDAVSLRRKLAQLGAEQLCRAIDLLEKDQHRLVVQDESLVTMAPKMTKDMGLISWKKTALDIHNLIRGLKPWPSAFTYFNGKLLKILDSQLLAEPSIGPLGAVMDIKKEGFVVATGAGSLLIKNVHPESSKAMDANSFVVGHGLKIGSLLSAKPQ